MRRTMATRPKATVLYATETGKSETLAHNLCSLFNRAFSTKVGTGKSPPNGQQASDDTASTGAGSHVC